MKNKGIASNGKLAKEWKMTGKLKRPRHRE
jgi:hypothetical protein